MHIQHVMLWGLTIAKIQVRKFVNVYGQVWNWFSKFCSGDMPLRELRPRYSSDLDEDALRELVECNPFWNKYSGEVKKIKEEKFFVEGGGQKSSPTLTTSLLLLLSVSPSCLSVSKASSHERKLIHSPLIKLLFMHMLRGVEIYIRLSPTWDTCFHINSGLESGQIFPYWTSASKTCTGSLRIRR